MNEKNWDNEAQIVSTSWPSLSKFIYIQTNSSFLRWWMACLTSLLGFRPVFSPMFFTLSHLVSFGKWVCMCVHACVCTRTGFTQHWTVSRNSMVSGWIYVGIINNILSSTWTTLLMPLSQCHYWSRELKRGALLLSGLTLRNLSTGFDTVSLHPSCDAFLPKLPLSLKFTGVLYTQIVFSRFFSSSHPLNIDSLEISNLGSLLHTPSLRNTDSYSFTCHLCAEDFQTYPLSSQSCIHKYCYWNHLAPPSLQAYFSFWSCLVTACTLQWHEAVW